MSIKHIWVSLMVFDPAALNRPLEFKQEPLKARPVSANKASLFQVGANGQKIMALFSKEKGPESGLSNKRGWDVAAILGQLSGQQSLSDADLKEIKQVLSILGPDLLQAANVAALSVVLTQNGQVQFKLETRDGSLHNSPFTAKQLMACIKSGLKSGLNGDADPNPAAEMFAHAVEENAVMSKQMHEDVKAKDIKREQIARQLEQGIKGQIHISNVTMTDQEIEAMARGMA